MPPAIERSVRKQNIKFMHNKNQFSAEYFQFIRKLVSCNSPPVNRQHSNEKLVSWVVESRNISAKTINLNACTLCTMLLLLEKTYVKQPSLYLILQCSSQILASQEGITQCIMWSDKCYIWEYCRPSNDWTRVGGLMMQMFEFVCVCVIV